MIEWDYVVDVDGTLCTAIDRDYVNAIPNMRVINHVNSLVKAGFSVLLYTARGQLSHKGNLESIELNVKPIIIEWLNKHNVLYTDLQMGKPYAKYGYIDDKAISVQDIT